MENEGTLEEDLVASFSISLSFAASGRKHVECVMKDSVAVVRLNSPDNKVSV